MNSKRWVVGMFTLMTLALTACGGGGSGSAPAPSVAAITAQLASQSVVAGTTAAFSVVASGTTGYQWQRSTDSDASNLLRLLKLPQPVQAMLLNGGLDMGHARALLALAGAQQITTANKIVAQKLSVRETEKIVQQLLDPEPKHKKPKPNRDILHLQEELAQRIGTGVQIKVGKKGAGKLILEYTSHDHLDELIQRLK